METSFNDIVTIHNDEENQFFKTVKFQNCVPFDFQIKWNVASIAGYENAEGYIIQHVIMKGPENKTPNTPYYEAWKVSEGKTDSGEYDDHFVCDAPIDYCTHVYWVDSGDELYSLVAKWEPTMGFFAGNLPAVPENDAEYLKKRAPRFNRTFSLP